MSSVRTLEEAFGGESVYSNPVLLFFCPFDACICERQYNVVSLKLIKCNVGVNKFFFYVILSRVPGSVTERPVNLMS